MTRLLCQTENQTVSMIHLTDKVQGGVRKADRLTMQEAAGHLAFSAPKTLSKLLVPPVCDKGSFF